MTETENRCELCGDFMVQGEYKCSHCGHNNALIVNKPAYILGEWNDDPLPIEAIPIADQDEGIIHHQQDTQFLYQQIEPWDNDPLPDYATEAIAGTIAKELIAANKVKAALDEQLAILKQQTETMKAVLQIIAYETARPFNPRDLAKAALEELEK